MKNPSIKDSGFVPVPGYEHCYNTDEDGTKVYWYLINNEGKVFSNRKNTPIEVSYMYFNKEHTLGPVVRLVDKDKKAKTPYVRRLVYMAFGKDQIDEVINGSLKVINLDGDIENNHIDNLGAFSAGELAIKNMHKTPHRNKFERADELPKDSVIIDGTFSITKDQVEEAYFEFGGLFHKVTHFKNMRSGVEQSGILGIRIKTETAPSYYMEYLEEKRAAKESKATRKPKKNGIISAEDKDFQTVPIAVILLNERYSIGRPGIDYHVSYRDGNSMNLTKENIFWESSKERAVRFRINNPHHEDLLRALSKERVQGDDMFFIEIEEKHILDGKKITDIIKEMGLDKKAYFRAYHYLKKVKLGEVVPKSPVVAEYLDSE